MIYQNALAEAAHQAVTRYIDGSLLNQKRVVEAIQALDKEALLAKNSQGEGQLINIVRLSMVMKMDSHSSTSCTWMISALLKHAAYTSSEALCFLLLQRSESGFAALHDILKSDNSENMSAYFDEVRQAVKDKWISEREYRHLLLSANDAGFTPLHHALASSSK